jgi:hypothetical protein
MPADVFTMPAWHEKHLRAATHAAGVALWSWNVRIRENREGYEKALRAADNAWDAGDLDFTKMESYLADLVQARTI